MSRPKKNQTPAEPPVKHSRQNHKIQTLKGFKDVLPEQQKFWNFVFEKVKDTADDYSFQKIDTPILESASLFQRTLGEETDIVGKEMYTFTDKSGELVTLRPEMTAPVARAYIEHGMVSWPQPVKLWYWASLFRHENPQAGRYREHHQFGYEILGGKEPTLDAELVIIAYGLYKSFGLEPEIEINSIGCQSCRKEYIKLLKKYFKDKKVCETCTNRLEKNPLRVLDCKENKCQENLKSAPQIIDYLCEDCKNHFVRLLEILDENSITYNLNPYLVRGLDYYNGTVFEIFVKGNDESRIALGGGGRYDYLIEQIGGRATPALGFAGGVERVVIKLKELGLEIKNEGHGDVFVAQLGDEARKKCMKLFNELRKQSIKTREAFNKKGLTEQLEIANRLKVKYALILGQKEIMEGTIIIRDMDSGVQEIIDFDKVIPEVKKRLLGLNGLKVYSENRITDN